MMMSSITISLRSWTFSHTSIYENSELNVFKKMKFVDGISNNWQNNLKLEEMYTKFLNLVDNHC